MSMSMYFVIFFAIGIYYLRIYMKGSMCHLTNRIDGKIALITGANTGLGLETSVELVSRGATVHITCRDDVKCLEAKRKIIERTGASEYNVVTHVLELASIRSILSFTKKFKESVERLDILINNAGIMMCPYQETEDGFEMQIGVNHLGHFLMTNELLELVKRGISPRIVIVSSLAHKGGTINRTDMNLRGEDYGRFAAYAQSKLANILHANVLAKRLKNDGVAVVSLHPGAVATDLERHYALPFQLIAALVRPILWKTPIEGAQTQICAAVDPDLMKDTGRYFNDCAPQESSNDQVYDEALAEHFWEQSHNEIKSKMDKLVL